MAVDIQKPLKKFLPYLLQAQAESLNEADTVQRLVKMFEDVLGYDVMSEVTREAQIKGGYVDLVIKVDGVIRFVVEAKAGGVTLRDRHMEQAERYASEGNIQWAILTNGVQWNLYHLTFDEGIEYERAFAVDLATDTLDQAAELLGLLHRQSVRKRALDEFWEHRIALSPESIGRALFTEDMLRFLRRSIRRDEGISIDEEVLAKALHEMLSTEARERIGPMKIRRKRKARVAKAPGEAAASASADGKAGGDEAEDIEEPGETSDE